MSAYSEKLKSSVPMKPTQKLVTRKRGLKLMREMVRYLDARFGQRKPYPKPMWTPVH